MDNKFDTATVISIVTGTILLIITFVSVWNTPFIPDEWAVRIGGAVLVLVASVSGTVTGLTVPVFSCLLTGIVFNRPDTFAQMGLLLVTGVITGHYADKIGIKYGRFHGISILDFAVIETGAAVISWLCLYPLLQVYVYRQDLRITVPHGLFECVISVGVKIFICLPVLLIFNHFFKKRQMVEDARREYLYHAGK